MQRTRKEWKEIVAYRLDDVYEGMIRKDSPNDILLNLRGFELISTHYDLTCLAVDVWYLFDRKPYYFKRAFSTVNVIRDPLIRVFFGIVVQAIHDVRLGRPCDATSWRTDHPPGPDGRCTPSAHLCVESALDFIAETGTLWETVLNLSEGTLAELVAKENGSVGSRSQAILNCTDQQS
jgi:hypothetical protein